MSLINDALKRARAAQRPEAPVAETGPQLRPIEPMPKPKPASVAMPPITLAILAIIALLIAWQWFHMKGSSQHSAAGTSAMAAAGADSAPARGNAKVTPATVTEISAKPNSAQPASSAPASEARAAEPSVHANDIDPNAAKTVVAPTIPRVEAGAAASAVQPGLLAPKPAPGSVPVVPKAAPMKLQAIVFNPTRPSAMIGGQTLFVGDYIGEMEVVAINRNSARLVGLGHTNVLTLAK